MRIDACQYGDSGAERCEALGAHWVSGEVVAHGAVPVATAACWLPDADRRPRRAEFGNLTAFRVAPASLAAPYALGILLTSLIPCPPSLRRQRRSTGGLLD